MSIFIEAVGGLANLCDSAANFFQRRVDRENEAEVTYKKFEDAAVVLTKYKKTGKIRLEVTALQGDYISSIVEITPAKTNAPQVVVGKVAFPFGRTRRESPIPTDEAQKIADAILPRLT